MAVETVSMVWVQEQTRNSFFSPGAMAFFASRLPKTALRNGDKVFFETSEQAPGGERFWTLRKLCLITGVVSTVGEFQAYPTAARAKRAVQDAARNN